MELTQYREIFQILKHGSEDVILTDVFVKAFRENMATESVQELSDLITCLDPLSTGQITFEQFLIAMKKIYANIDHQAENTIKNESSLCEKIQKEPHNSEESFVIRTEKYSQTFTNLTSTPLKEFKKCSHKDNIKQEFDISNGTTFINSQTESLISFGDTSNYDDDFVKFNQSNYSCDEAIKNYYNEQLDIEQLSSSPKNMSVFNNQRIREEHYEFTPSPESGSKRHADFNGDDTDFSVTSNGDSSYHSLKSPSFGQRNTWLRSSLRRTGCSLRRNSSLATNYRSSPTQERSASSRRSSLSYESDEMIAGDGQLEEDVQNLNDKLKKLQDQVELLTNAHEKNEAKYSNMLRENNNLNDKINYLEEQIRDFDLKSEQRSTEEEKRHREAMERLSREKLQETESIMEQFLSTQKELLTVQNDIKLSQQQVDNLKCVKIELETRIQDRDHEIINLKDEINRHEETIKKKIEELSANLVLIDALNRELSMVKTQSIENSKIQQSPNVEIIQRNQELEQQLRMIKQENSVLKEVNEDLTAQVLNNHLIEGKNLLKDAESGSSLAAELGDLNSEELKTKLKDKEEEAAKLREYIDKMLEKIVLHYPKLLEVSNN